MELNVLVEEIISIARKAGEGIMSIYQDEGSFEIVSKSDKTPLTNADTLSNSIIMEGLSNLPVTYPVISEENKQVEYEKRKEFERFWLVDPLDGTKEFIKRNGEFTVNIALLDGDSVILGVVYIPVTGEVYYAIKNGGSYCRNEEGDIQLKANKFSLVDKGLRIVCSRSHINQKTEDYIAQLDQPEIVSRGSSLKFIIIAKGEAEIYPRIGPTMEWDTAAAQIVLEESGGSVREIENNRPLRYNKESLLNPFFVAMANLE